MLCAAPTMTASMRGVVPSAAIRGVTCATQREVLSSATHGCGGLRSLRGKRVWRDRRTYKGLRSYCPGLTCVLKRVRPKKVAPVAKSSVGVTSAATPQPQIWSE